MWTKSMCMEVKVGAGVFYLRKVPHVVWSNLWSAILQTLALECQVQAYPVINQNYLFLQFYIEYFFINSKQITYRKLNVKLF